MYWIGLFKPAKLESYFSSFNSSNPLSLSTLIYITCKCYATCLSLVSLIDLLLWLVQSHLASMEPSMESDIDALLATLYNQDAASIATIPTLDPVPTAATATATATVETGLPTTEDIAAPINGESMPATSYQVNDCKSISRQDLVISLRFVDRHCLADKLASTSGSTSYASTATSSTPSVNEEEVKDSGFSNEAIIASEYTSPAICYIFYTYSYIVSIYSVLKRSCEDHIALHLISTRILSLIKVNEALLDKVSVIEAQLEVHHLAIQARLPAPKVIHDLTMDSDSDTAGPAVRPLIKREEGTPPPPPSGSSATAVNLEHRPGSPEIGEFSKSTYVWCYELLYLSYLITCILIIEYAGHRTVKCDRCDARGTPCRFLKTAIGGLRANCFRCDSVGLTCSYAGKPAKKKNKTKSESQFLLYSFYLSSLYISYSYIVFLIMLCLGRRDDSSDDDSDGPHVASSAAQASKMGKMRFNFDPATGSFTQVKSKK